MFWKKKKRTLAQDFSNLFSLIIFKALPVSQLYKLFTCHAPLIPQENTLASEKYDVLVWQNRCAEICI